MKQAMNRFELSVYEDRHQICLTAVRTSGKTRSLIDDEFGMIYIGSQKSDH